MGYQKILKRKPNFHQDKYKDNYEDAEEYNDTQDMKMKPPEEDMISGYDQDKVGDVIIEQEVDCAGVR